MEWQFIGDVNPIEHGGTWIKKDKDFPSCYYAEKWIPFDCEQGGYLFTGLYIDITDSWIESESVKSYAGITDINQDILGYIDALISYYGAENFSGHVIKFNDESEVIKELTEKGITIN